MTTSKLNRMRVVFIIAGILSLIASIVAWTTVVDRPLTKQYVEFVQRAGNLSVEERARQRGTIQKFDYSGVWREPNLYMRAFCPAATAISFLLAFHRRIIVEK